MLTWCLHTFFRPAVNRLVVLFADGFPKLLGTSWPQPAIEQACVMLVFTAILLIRYQFELRKNQ